MTDDPKPSVASRLRAAMARLTDQCTDGDGFTETTHAELSAAVEQAAGHIKAQAAEIERLRRRLAEGLDLSVRARKLDEQIEYDQDLAAWQDRARAALDREGE